MTVGIGSETSKSKATPHHLGKSAERLTASAVVLGGHPHDAVFLAVTDEPTRSQIGRTPMETRFLVNGPGC